MNLFPLIHRSKKTHNFANPLNGLIYHSDIDPPRKEALSTISYSEASQTNRNHTNISTLKTNSNYKFKMERLDDSLQKQRFTVVKSSKVIKPAQLFGGEGERATARLKSSNSHLFHFPDVEVFPLYLISNYQDIAKYKIKVNLQKYFQVFFSNGFRHNIASLNQMLQKYVPLLKKYDLLDREVEKKKWPKEFWEVRKVDELIALMKKYDKPTSEYWIKYLLILALIYCVPHHTVRQSSLDNLLLLTRHHIKQVFEIHNPKAEFVFLLDNGTIVQDFIDIPFSATRLYMAIKKSTEKQTVQPYFDMLKIIKNYRQQCKKKGFVGRLRRHFRNQIAFNKYNEETINYDADHSSKEKERKTSLYNAMMILQRKKQNQSHTKTLSSPSPRPKSYEQIWKQQNIENNSSHDIELQKFAFHLYLNNHNLQLQIRSQFEKYHALSVAENGHIQQDQLYVYILQKYHPVISAMSKSLFHSMKIKNIFETLLNEKIAENRQLSRTVLQWRNFIQFSILSSKHLKKLIEVPDCMELVRNFIESYLEISDDDYYRDELTAKLYRMIDADSTTLSMIEELIWSWLTQNGFIRLGAVQRQLLWTYHQRSKTFYLLMISSIFGTYSTTPLDLAFQLLM